VEPLSPTRMVRWKETSSERSFMYSPLRRTWITSLAEQPKPYASVSTSGGALVDMAVAADGFEMQLFVVEKVVREQVCSVAKRLWALKAALRENGDERQEQSWRAKVEGMTCESLDVASQLSANIQPRRQAEMSRHHVKTAVHLHFGPRSITAVA
jgi:hypothetical protein